MIRWLVIGVVAYVLYKLASNEMRKRAESRSGGKIDEAAQKAATGDMVKDPVCGTYVETTGSVSIRDGDVVHRFCSYECRDAFLQRLKGEGRAIPEEKKD